ncbi:MAG: DsbA family protein [Pseudomonadota bacterium]
MSDSCFYYVHDPMCSWCWGHRPVWDQFESSLLDIVNVKTLVGGLAPDCDDPMPEQQRAAISGYWCQIQSLLGTEFNFDFWTKNTPRRSTYPACRAVIAARYQSTEREMIHALQEAYYLRALNPSNTATHLQLAEELGLDTAKFEIDIKSKELQSEFEQEMVTARNLPIQGFPSMVLVHNGIPYPIQLDYKNYREAFTQVKMTLAD